MFRDMVEREIAKDDGDGERARGWTDVLNAKEDVCARN